MDPASTLMPAARTDELVVEELPDETLVYDLKRHKAHCLNRTSSLVWQHCDGRTTTTQVAEMLEEKLGLPRDEQIVGLALDRLRRAKLLADGTYAPGDEMSYSRRELVRKLAVVGGLTMLLPVITSLRSPLAAQLGSSVTFAQCKQCIGVGLPCSDRIGTCTANSPTAGKCRCV